MKPPGKTVNSHLESHLTTIRALIKFCRDHGRKDTALQQLPEYEAALYAGEVGKAFSIFRSIKFSGMGGFDDWIPGVINDNETEEYNYQVLVALSSLCGRQFHLLSTK